ncbi:hypothetical protein Gotur_022281, partial [Gossypium turneri]
MYDRAFTCEICKFWLHPECALISHPSHSQHPLQLIYEDKHCCCNGCSGLSRNWLYRCQRCDFNLDLSCASSTTIPTPIDKEINHFCHHHTLTQFNYRKVSKYHPSCFWCVKLLSGACYVCLQCDSLRLCIHESCLINMPTVITEHPFHPSHPLYIIASSESNVIPVFIFVVYYMSLVLNTSIILTNFFVEDFSDQYYCDICEQERVPQHPVCRFVAHIGCALTEIKDYHGSASSLVGGKGTSIGKLMEQDERDAESKIEYFDHEHPLCFKKVAEQNGSAICKACFLEISDEAYACKSCKYYIHKTCTNLPWEVLHPLHPHHSLKLLSEVRGKVFSCDGCREVTAGFAYACSMCGFMLDVKCALLRALCDKCNKHMYDRAFTCEICKFWLHPECALISHPSHSQHPLQLIYEDKHCCCNGCSGLSRNWLYRCQRCDFNLDLSCASSTTIPTPIDKEINHFCHHHTLTQFNYRKVSKYHPSCFWCVKLLSGACYVCLQCDSLRLCIHESCLINMPTVITEHPFHPSHPLYIIASSESNVIPVFIFVVYYMSLVLNTSIILTNFFVEDFSDQYYCDICEQERVPQHPVCRFVAHIGCALTEIKDYHGSASSLVGGKGTSIGKLMEQDERDAESKIEYFDHEHPLCFKKVAEQNGSAICKACFLEISDEAYACKSCKYYIHKTCTNLPWEVLHPLHPHHSLKLLSEVRGK